MRLPKLDTGVGATKPEELKNDAGARTHEGRLVRSKPEVQGTPHDGGRQRRSADRRKRRTTFHLAEPSTSEVQKLGGLLSRWNPNMQGVTRALQTASESVIRVVATLMAIKLTSVKVAGIDKLSRSR